ncbi:MAG: class II aldolase/adducin family protein [Rhodospirillaceae bacterium]|nr:class II aldolase/adducin family protein [Rhodospirillaceae bacterium]
MSNPSIAESALRHSENEWATRVELAALYRVADRYGMTDIANQEIGARVRGEPDRFLIHPYGLLFEEVRASDFVKVGLDGAVADGRGIWNGSGQENFAERSGERWVSDGGVNLGRWIFGARPDCNFFIHAHCEDVMAVSATEGGLRPVSQAFIYLRAHIAYLDYDFAEDDEYAAGFLKAIADRDILISHNHGYYALGRSAAEAFFRAFYLRQACAVQVKAAATAAGMGEGMREIDPQRVAMIEDQMRESAHYHYDGSTEWAALLRKLERECPDYRT